MIERRRRNMVMNKPPRLMKKQDSLKQNSQDNIAYHLVITGRWKICDIPISKMSYGLMKRLFMKNPLYFRQFYNMENLLRIQEEELNNNTDYLDCLYREIEKDERLCKYLIKIVPDFVAQISFINLTQDMVRIAYSRKPLLKNHFYRIGIKIVD